MAFEGSVTAENAAAIRAQLERLVAHDQLRTSRRSVAFLRYIVERTLAGNADELKERTIGINVFGKALTYDTSLDHVVRTAASELRKRLQLYYGQDAHRAEVQIQLLPGSYVPQFRVPSLEQQQEGSLPASVAQAAGEPDASRADGPLPGLPWGRAGWMVATISLGLLLATGALVRAWRSAASAQQQFWAPLLSKSGPVTIAVGDVPNGPPVLSADAQGGSQAQPNAASGATPRVSYADMVTVARLTGLLGAMGKEFVIRRENTSTFADLRERPLVLVGAFNNEWSLRLTQGLRFTLAVDEARRVIYIRDREHPESREWQWGIDPHPAETDRNAVSPLQDYALVSRVLDSETGHEVLIVGGLYTYGTQAAGEFLADPAMLGLAQRVTLDKHSKRLQIVLQAQVRDGAAGPPRIVAVSAE